MIIIIIIIIIIIHITLITTIVIQTKHQATLDIEHGLLPHVSCSLWALLVLLTRWCASAKKCGAFAIEQQRQAAAACLSSIVADVMVVSPREINLGILLQQDRQPQLPKAVQAPDVVLQIIDGKLQWRKFVVCVKSQRYILGSGWWSDESLDELDSAMHCKSSMTELLQATCGSMVFSSVHAQLIWALGWTWQQLVVGLHKDSTRRHPSLQCHEVEEADLMGCAVDMDNQLANYMMCSQQATCGLLRFNCSTDKAGICGLGSGVQGTVWTVAWNLAILSPPQALCV